MLVINIPWLPAIGAMEKNLYKSTNYFLSFHGWYGAHPVSLTRSAHAPLCSSSTRSGSPHHNVINTIAFHPKISPHSHLELVYFVFFARRAWQRPVVTVQSSGISLFSLLCSESLAEASHHTSSLFLAVASRPTSSLFLLQENNYDVHFKATSWGCLLWPCLWFFLKFRCLTQSFLHSSFFPIQNLVTELQTQLLPWLQQAQQWLTSVQRSVELIMSVLNTARVESMHINQA